MVIKKGSKGAEVKKIQTLLGLVSDGDFGVKTEAAVKQWQTNHGLVADGIVGDKTWTMMFGTDNSKCVDSSVIYDPLSVHVTKSPNRPILYLAIHFTAGSNSKQGRAKSTKSTFEKRQASADFCVDDVDIVQFNPDLKNYYCWAVGDSKNYLSGGGFLYGKATNKNTISIEVCSTCVPATSEAVSHSNHEGWSFTDKALNNAVKLSKILMKKYNIPIDRVVRHYDISGKLCPGIIGWNNGPKYNMKGVKQSEKNDSRKWDEFKKLLD